MELIPIIIVLVLLLAAADTGYLVKERVPLNCERGPRGPVYRRESTTQ
jgi:hypothetical protein